MFATVSDFTPQHRTCYGHCFQTLLPGKGAEGLGLENVRPGLGLEARAHRYWIFGRYSKRLCSPTYFEWFRRHSLALWVFPYLFCVSSNQYFWFISFRNVNISSITSEIDSQIIQTLIHTYGTLGTRPMFLSCLKPWSRAWAWASEISSPSRGIQARPGPEHH
jgi:hypothetical protein